jgi:formate/nitrite transporter FocA (FNT family)
MNQPHALSLCDVDEAEHDTLSHACDRVSEAGYMLEGGACAVWHKAALGVAEALALGVLCNGLVCLAVWLAMGGRSVADKVLAIVFPITAFVTMGFEHSIANLFFPMT